MKWVEIEQGRCRMTYAADIPGGVLVLVDLHDGNGHAGAMTFIPGIKMADLGSVTYHSETAVQHDFAR